MTPIANWKTQNNRCHFCGEARSVKYVVDGMPCCNKCALANPHTIKQYTVDDAYIGNYSVRKYVDGKCISHEIVSGYELDGYQVALEIDGFEQAYDADKAKEEMDRALADYEGAVNWYNFVKEHALVKEELK